MTIAITPFEGLCGFRPLPEIAHFLQTVPSLRKLVGEEKAKKFEEVAKDPSNGGKEALRDAFTSLMNTDEETLAAASKELVEQAKSEGAQFAGEGGPSNSGEELSEVVVRLDGQFPQDIGLFVFFFLNFVKLNPGEGMFLRADDIHAYISGGEKVHAFPQTTLTGLKTSSSAWLRRITSFARGLPPSSRTSRP